jgi:rare lipoprotein A
MPKPLFAALLLACLMAGHAEAQTCKASFYYEGSRTANGERFRPDNAHDLTAAHRTLPFGTRIRVTYRGTSIVVRINDRGPAKWTGRCIDLSRAAAKQLGFLRAGVVTVSIEII